MHNRLKILHLEDEIQVTDIVYSLLSSEGFDPEIMRVETKTDFLAKTENGRFNLILADFQLPGFDGLTALTLAKDRCPEIPFILFTGAIGEEMAIEALKNGATDYVLKQKITKLVPAVRRALKEAQESAGRKLAEDDLKKSEKEKSLILNSISEFCIYYNLEMRIEWANKAAKEAFGLPDAELVGKECYEVWHKQRGPCEDCPVLKTRSSGLPADAEVCTPEQGVWHFRSYPVKDQQGEITGIIELGEDVTDKYKNKVALVEAEKKYRSLFNNALEGIFQSTPDGKYISGNPALARMFGYTSPGSFMREIRDISQQAYANPEKREEFRRLLEKKEKLTNYEIEFQRKDKSRFWGSVNATVIRDENGKVAYYEGTMEDVTEEKIARRELAQQKELLQTILDNIPVMISLIHPDGRYRWVNDAWEKILGWTIEDTRKLDILKELYPGPEHRKFVSEYITHPPEGWFDFKTRIRDGKILDTSWMNVLLSDGSSIGIGIDITQRKLSEQKLMETTRLLEKTFDSLDEAVFIINPLLKRSIVNCNKAVEQIFGYMPQELIGKSSDILHVDHEHFEEFGRSSEAVLQKRGNFHTEFSMKRRDGQIINTDHTVTMLNPEEGWKGGVVSIVRDITEHKKNIEDLKKSREQLRSLAAHLQTVTEKEKSNIAREIHDELGQVLAVIKLNLTMLRNEISEADGKLDPNSTVKEIDSMRAFVESTIGNVKRMITELRPEVLDNLELPEALEWQIREFENRTGIRCEFSANTWKTNISKEESIAAFRILQEALTNIARHANATNVNVVFDYRKDKLQLKIIDDGAGISGERLKAGNSFGILGMKERANALGGRVNIISGKKGGTSVVLDLPSK